MKTIPRNHTRKIAEIKKSIVKVVFYNQNNGSLEVTTLEHAMNALYHHDFSKLYANDDGKYTVHVHSNLWYYLYTQNFLDTQGADKAAREQRAAAHPKPVRASTREERQVRTMASTVSIHDLGKPAPAPVVTVTRTRMAIGDQIAEACAALGIELSHGYAKGAATYVVNGRDYTAGELADLVLEGGFDANFGGNATRVRWDSPLRVLPTDDARKLGEAIETLNEVLATPVVLNDPKVSAQITKTRQWFMNELHLRALASKPAPKRKIDFLPGSAEPPENITIVECVRTGRHWAATGPQRPGRARWIHDHIKTTWYHLNIVNPMSEGFYIVEDVS